MLPNPRWFIPAVIAFTIIFYGTVLCHACSRNAETLRADVLAKFDILKVDAAEEGINIILICAQRSQEDQDILYAKGRTAPGPIVTWVRESKHTKGLAFDISVIENGKAVWDGSKYVRIGALGQKLGLIWGGAWEVKDYGHFEMEK